MSQYHLKFLQLLFKINFGSKSGEKIIREYYNFFLKFWKLNNLIYGQCFIEIIYFLMNRKKFIEPLDNSKKPGFSHIYRNPECPDHLISSPKGDYENVRDLLQQKCLTQFPSLNYLGRMNLTSIMQNGKPVEKRQITSFKYREVFQIAQNLGSWMLKNQILHDQPYEGMKLVGIISKNRYEWIVVDHACCIFGITLVPLYETFGPENMQYCLEHCGITSCFVTQQAIDTLLKLKTSGNLKTLISLDQIPNQKKLELTNLGFKYIPFGAAIQRSQQKLINYKQIPISRKTVMTFSYTSGTTGRPKGAMITHGNILSNIVILTQNGIGAFNNQEILQPGDVHFSYLPLVHVFERGGIMYSLFHGMQVIFSSGDVTKLKDDMYFAKPHLFMGVPRIFHRVADGIKAKFDNMGSYSKKLINWAYQAKLNKLERTGSYNSCFFDKIFFSAIRDAFGGRLKLIISGGAPIKPETYQFMKVVTSTPMTEGYGLTQSSLLILLQTPDNCRTGHLGKLMNTWQLKLADIPEMNYTSNDRDQHGNLCPRGEIWVRGSGVFKGYYRDPERTKQMFSEDGWLKTGDVGMIFQDQSMIKIIDRKKNIFKLQQGQYIAPEKVQAIYTSQFPISEAFVYGDSTSDFLIVFVSGAKESLIKFAKLKGIYMFFEDLCEEKKFKSAVLRHLQELGKKKGLKGFQQAKNIYIQQTSFFEKGILTNTMKMKRFQARKCYEKQIKLLYEEGPLFAN